MNIYTSFYQVYSLQGFVYSADADADANACNVARVSCNITGGAVAVWVASRPEACRLSQLQGCGFESAPLTSIA